MAGVGGGKFLVVDLLAEFVDDSEVVGIVVGVDDALVDRIRDHHVAWDHTYGYWRITAELSEDPAVKGPVNHKRVARLMHEHTIVGVNLRKPHITTVKDPKHNGS